MDKSSTCYLIIATVLILQLEESCVYKKVDIEIEINTNGLFYINALK